MKKRKQLWALILVASLLIEGGGAPLLRMREASARSLGFHQTAESDISGFYPTPTPSFLPEKTDNPIRVKAKNLRITEGPRTRRARKKYLKVRKAAGTVTYQKIKGNKKIRVDRNTGKLTVGWRLSRGVHKIRVAVTASGDDTHLSGQVVVTVRINIVPLELTDTEKRYYTKSVNWGLCFPEAHGTPSGSVPFSGFSLKKFNAVYYGNRNKKRAYLTFDCGYENGNTARILKVLKKKKVKALFFVTKAFVEERPDLVKRMKRQGHLVGNHTVTHPYMSKCSTERLKNEILGVEKAMKKKTGYKMDRFLRPPCGNYSIKSLEVTRKLGYKTVLWGLAWYDYDPAHQPPVSSVIDKFVQHHHKGILPLMHNTSSADTAALPSIISYMKKQKYKFRLLKQ